MADTEFFFLVQWEDRYLSVISPKAVVNPKKNPLEYKEGELIKAVYSKRKQSKKNAVEQQQAPPGKIYDAVICEIHPNLKFLQQQAKLPPKYYYEVEKMRQKSTANAESMSHSATEHMSHSTTKEPMSQSATTESRSGMATNTELKSALATAAQAKPSTTTTAEPKATATEPKQLTPLRPSTESPTTMQEKRGLPAFTSDELKEDIRSLRRKVRRLEERLTVLENSAVNVENSSDKHHMASVEHIDEANDKLVLKTLTKGIFSDEELINFSRTGKKTSKCNGDPRPALDQSKLETLQRLFMKKTNMSREVFIKKFENLQKTLRQKNRN